MVKINGYSIRRSGNRFEIYWQNNEFCRYADTLKQAISYVTMMLYCVACKLTDFIDCNVSVKVYDRQMYFDFV